MYLTFVWAININPMAMELIHIQMCMLIPLQLPLALPQGRAAVGVNVVNKIIFGGIERDV